MYWNISLYDSICVYILEWDVWWQLNMIMLSKD